MLCGCFSFVSKLVLTNHADDRGVKIDTELVEQAIACELMLSDAICRKHMTEAAVEARKIMIKNAIDNLWK